MKSIILLLFIILLLNQVFSQVKPFNCKTVEMNKLAEEKDPNVKQRRDALAEFTKNYIKSKNKSDDIYVIPVVFHIVHDFGVENISKAQIEDAIRILNNDYRKLNADSDLVIPEFQGIAADSRIEFRLARIDPIGNCTEGITRTYSPLTTGAGENVKEVALSWPRAMYLNIWVVRSISGSAAAYAYYPGTADDGWDGILCTHTYVGSIGTSNSGSSRVLTHEIGHYLNLAHPWGNSNDPGVPENCSIDDGISDTPLTIGHTSCNVYAQSCGSLDNVQNYMEYSYCCKMFTMGQKDVMRAALNSSASDRNNLWTDNNRLATGTNDGFIVQECQPVTDFYYQAEAVCIGVDVQFNDLSYNSDTIDSWNWSFPGGNPSSSIEQNPVVTYNVTGSYDVTLITSNIHGSDTMTIIGLITVNDPTVGELVPFIEGFENQDFPLNLTDNNKSWTIIEEGSSSWQRTTWTSFSGNACLRIANFNNHRGDVNTLISPNIVMDTTDNLETIYFKIAYARKDNQSDDELRIYVSANCGESWHLRYSKSGYILSTTYQGQIYSGAFTPTISEWREDYINLGQYSDSENLMVKFECISDRGNWLYIDDINFNQDQSSINDNNNYSKINVFPNPFNNDLFINYTLEKQSKVSISLTNILGEIIFIDNVEQNKGEYNINFRKEKKLLKSGIFFLNVLIDNNKYSKKIIKLK